MNVSIATEIIKTLPSLIWASLATGLIVAFYKPIRYELIPRMTGLKALGVEATFVKRELDQVAEIKPAGTEESRDQVARRAQRIANVIRGSRVLLVNDSPNDMQHFTSILKSLGIVVTIASSTSQALVEMAKHSHDIIISDMRRGNSSDEGLRFLNETIVRGSMRPTIFTVGQYEPERGVPPYAFGITNRIDELLNLVFDALERVRG